MATEIRVPTLGESATEATIGRWFKKVGESIAADEPVVELETDKVTVEVPAPSAGTLEEIIVKEGETVEVGALLGSIADGAKASAPAKPAAAKPAVAEVQAAKADTKAEAKPSAGGRLVELKVPSAGESVTEAQVGEIYKKVGDRIEVDEPILELETDKAAQEIPSPAAGVLRELLVKTGDEGKIGALLARIE